MTGGTASNKREFIDFMVRCGVLTFGDFVTKSGRRTPFFVNTGRYRTGDQLRQLAGFYARTITEQFGDGFDVLFGPAYKGIPLAVAIAMELAGRRAGTCLSASTARKRRITGKEEASWATRWPREIGS